MIDLTLDDIRDLWQNCDGEVSCSTKCEFGYLDNAPGSGQDSNLCKCGAVALTAALDLLLIRGLKKDLP